MKTKHLLLCAAVISSFAGDLYSQTSASTKKVQQTDSISANKKEEKNRNVMLNADSNIGPRNVNIGLPFTGDVVILENDLPVVYYFYPTIPTTSWRMDNSLSKMGLMSFAESAITTGKVGYAVKSSDRDASSTTKGFGSVYINSFGSSRYDLTLTGPIAKGWGYMLDLYQNFDRGNNCNLKFTPWLDKTSMVKFAIQKKYAKGNVRLLYKYLDSKSIVGTFVPFTYNGNGKTSALANFDPGTDSYILESGKIPCYDYNTGTATVADLSSDKYTRTNSHNIYLNGEHNFGDGWKLTYSTMYQHINSPLSIGFPVSVNTYAPDQATAKGWGFKYVGTSNAYTGTAQMVSSQIIPQSNNNSIFSRAELTKQLGGHELRFGLNQLYTHRQYHVNSGIYFQTVEANPKLLDMYPAPNFKYTTNGLMPTAAGGFGSATDDQYIKEALYITDDIKLSKKLDIGLGLRIENQSIKENSNPYINDFVKDRPLIANTISNKWNKVGTASFVYKMTKEFGFLGDGTYNTWWERYWDYGFKDAKGNPIADPSTPGAKAMQTVCKPFQTKVLNLGGGIFYNLGTTIQLVSKLTYISKDNIRASQSVTNPANQNDRTTFDPIIYSLSTLGWTTDILATPIKNFSIHYLLTLQAPKYRNYSYSAYGTTFDYNNRYIPELSGVLMEIDPSYSFSNGIRIWTSMRYFGKQYGNATNAFYYNGWWENFGGVDYRLSRNVNLKLQVTNFLNQKGIKGKVQGSDQVTDASSYVGRTISASGIRPRTLEFTCQYKF